LEITQFNEVNYFFNKCEKSLFALIIEIGGSIEVDCRFVWDEKGKATKVQTFDPQPKKIFTINFYQTKRLHIH